MQTVLEHKNKMLIIYFNSSDHIQFTFLEAPDIKDTKLYSDDLTMKEAKEIFNLYNKTFIEINPTPTTTITNLKSYSSSNATSNIDQFFHTLTSQHKQTITIHILFIVSLLLILVFSVRKLFRILQKKTSTKSLYTDSNTELQTERYLDQNTEDNDNAIQETKNTMIHSYDYDSIA